MAVKPLSYPLIEVANNEHPKWTFRHASEAFWIRFGMHRVVARFFCIAQLNVAHLLGTQDSGTALRGSRVLVYCQHVSAATATEGPGRETMS